MKLDDMSWNEAVKKCKGKIILIPHGSTEEHGYHLPIKTDALVAEHVCKIFYNSKDVVVAPVMNYTGVVSTKQMPGTIGPNKEEYESWIRTILSDILKLKPKKIFFFLGHDGNTQREILNKIKKEFGIVDYLGSSSLEAKQKGIIETGGHAGEGETSIMLYIDKKNVNMKRAVNERWPSNFKEIGISKSGVDGYPTKATQVKGKKMLLFMQKKLKEAMR
ncbi:MAG: creatininase family protein [Candidatus Aenigmarchaeota archaeon]|nr:creatininase family protein [Candidatus Aenigmarchaeota archaeon]